MTEEFLCARCARVQKTCCQQAEVFVTLGDLRRIAEFGGFQEVAEYRRADDPQYADQDDDPVWRDQVLRPDGTRRVLKRKPNGDCTFLGAAGCLLPLDVRPLVCRLYPFEYNHEQLEEGAGAWCPRALLRPGQDLFEALAMNRAEAEDWHRRLYAEIQAEHAEHADRADLRPAF